MPSVAAVVLAAGLSRRMAPHNKLLLRDRSGRAMVARTVDAMLASRARSVWVVLGHQAAQVAAALEGRLVQLVRADDYASGLAHSLARGIAALPAETDAALICLADMPLLSVMTINSIIDTYAPGRIVIPMHGGRRANPVLWDRRFFPEIVGLSGDRGASALFARHAAHIHEVEVPLDDVLTDFDTIEAMVCAR